MYRWELEKRVYPLKFVWKISRGESTEKTLNFVKLLKDGIQVWGEIAGITSDEKKNEFLESEWNRFQKANPQSLEEIFNLELPSHLEFGVSSAMTHFLAVSENKSLGDYLDIPQTPSLPTSFSLPILPTNEITGFVKKFDLTRFPVLKIKISRELSYQNCIELAKTYTGPLRVDANESFQSANEVLEFMHHIKDLNIQFVEEPLKRNSVDEYKKLKILSQIPIFADESVQRDIFDEGFKDQFHGINIKLMKAGSYQRALHQIQRAKAMGLKTMLGCMVESSLGILGALAISNDVDYFDLDGFLYFKNEPFKLVTENKGYLTYRQEGLANITLP